MCYLLNSLHVHEVMLYHWNHGHGVKGNHVIPYEPYYNPSDFLVVYVCMYFDGVTLTNTLTSDTWQLVAELIL